MIKKESRQVSTATFRWIRSIFVILWCHFSVSLLCFNVLFDLVFFGIPFHFFRWIGAFSEEKFACYINKLINWTTPIVLSTPMVFSGTNIYCNNIDLLFESKSDNSLLLANHGSRIDWMVGMFCGYTTDVGGKSCARNRVGFVCEGILQFMPIVGWYRKFINNDIFVWRSFRQDKPTIENNIAQFHRVGAKRMLFLSPEGVIVDFSEQDKEYIKSCQKFCVSQGYNAFDYVLTPRYKGTSCLANQVVSGGPIVSICVAYVQCGKLLNCKLLSENRVVPDIYTMNQGIGGKPIDIYIDLVKLPSIENEPDAKKYLFLDYQRKDKLLSNWDIQIAKDIDTFSSKFTILNKNKSDAVFAHIYHGVMMVGMSMWFGQAELLVRSFFILLFLVCACHTFGWMMNSTSMESVPFETGIKAALIYLSKKKSGKSKK